MVLAVRGTIVVDGIGDTPPTAWVVPWISAVVAFGPWASVDEALVCAAQFVCLPPLAGARLAVRRIELHQDTHRVTLQVPWMPVRVEPKPWGRVDVVAETGAVELVRLVLHPGGTLPNHVHHRMREVEHVLDDGLTGWEDGGPDQRLPRGHERHWCHGQPHGYRNDSDRPLGILCLDAPGFDADDEIILPRMTP